MMELMTNSSLDFAALGRELDLSLLRAIALGGKRSADLSLLLDSQKSGKADFQALALTLADLSVPEELAKRSFVILGVHQERLREQLGREVGLKTAALDLLENAENALKLDEGTQAPSYFQLEQMAFRDQLTGLQNYRSFSIKLEEELRRAKRYRHQLSLLMLDIDHFKKFNDTHGHPGGNVALRHLAGLLKEAARETDIVARYGGEEFAIILPETTKRLAFDMASRLRSNIESNPVSLDDGGHHRITVSIGVATFSRDAWGLEALIEGSDAALYQSKKFGRNRVSEFQPLSFALFRYRPEVGQVVQKVSVVGNFNGWDVQADPMHPQDDGSFSSKVHLIPATYEYKFVLNGESWISDPASGEYISDGYWGQNSILHVTKQ
jgi:diguanylate cyclase (GGDEF)-like protein